MQWSKKDSKRLIRAIDKTDHPVESASAAIGACVAALVHHAGGQFTKQMLMHIVEGLGDEDGLMKETDDEREN